jgi:hypothetical protein
MIIGISEGTEWRYEVIARTDGFIVQPRDLTTNALEHSQRTHFRTAVAAFAYAELSAALDRTAAARLSGDEPGSFMVELEERAAGFHELAARLSDSGTAAAIIAEWEDRDTRSRRSLH